MRREEEEKSMRVLFGAALVFEKKGKSLHVSPKKKKKANKAHFCQMRVVDQKNNYEKVNKNA